MQKQSSMKNILIVTVIFWIVLFILDVVTLILDHKNHSRVSPPTVISTGISILGAVTTIYNYHRYKDSQENVTEMDVVSYGVSVSILGILLMYQVFIIWYITKGSSSSIKFDVSGQHIYY